MQVAIHRWDIERAGRAALAVAVLLLTAAVPAPAQGGAPAPPDAPGQAIAPVTGPDQVANDLLERVAANDLDAAVTLALPVVAAAKLETETGHAATPRLLAALVHLAQACREDGRSEQAADVYHHAAMLVAKPSADWGATWNVQRRTALWLAAAKELTAVGRHADSLRWLQAIPQAVPAGEDLPGHVVDSVGERLVEVASGLLDEQSLEAAAGAYQIAADLGVSAIASGSEPPPERKWLPTARLGSAWALTMIGTDDERALAAVKAFLDDHADHPDASSAMLLKITCLSRMDQREQAEACRDQLLTRYPRSDAATQIAVVACEDCVWSRAAVEDESVTWIDYVLAHADQVARSTRTRARGRLLASGLVLAVLRGDAEAEKRFAGPLAGGEGLAPGAAGKAISDVLHFLESAGHASDAERLALAWLSAAPPRRPAAANGPAAVAAPVVREAVARWAGRTERWSLLTTIAAGEQPSANFVSSSTRQAKSDPVDDSDDALEHRGDETMRASADEHELHVARLFAEAFLQTGQTKQSLRWWEAIVDQGGADDFPTLLRLAETAVAASSVTQAATRLASARAVADATTHEMALVDLLAADIHVRQLNFDRGRGLLERVVRSSAADAGLRGRAQWMIGETFFMQQRFAEAIDAYRLVEGISGDPHWTAASLVQAGKSFEQLGRTREAAVCYATLVSRFGDSQHASGARDRLATLRPDASAPSGSIRR